MLSSKLRIMQNNSRKKFIGVFDSGFGGLVILKEIVKKLPDYNYIYLGDTARAPYGTRSQETVYKFTEQAVDFLFKKGCWLIILACNTASAEALRKIQKSYLPRNYSDKRVLGVIRPVSEEAGIKTINNKIGVIATNGTVKSNAFKRELKKMNPRMQVFQQAAPLLVPLVEAGEHNSKAADLIIKNYLRSLIKNKIDTLVLGCTHYGILKEKIKKIVGKNVNVVMEGKIVAGKLKDYLRRHPEINGKIGKQSKTIFYTTDLTDNFSILGSKFFGKKIKPEKIKLD